MKPCSPPQEKNKIAGNHDGSFMDVTLVHIVAVFSPLVIVRGLQKGGEEGKAVQSHF